MFGRFFGELGSNLLKEVLQDNKFGAQLGRFLGNNLGKLIENQILYSNESDDYYNNNFIEEKIKFQDYGKPIDLIFGQCRIFGNIIWALPVEEKEVNVSILPNCEETANRFFANFAVALCEGIMDDVNTVWLDDETVDLSNFKYRIYQGTETQNPDPLIVLHEGETKTPAFRGLAYIVFENLPLETFDNKIPNFSFEVRRKPKKIINSDTRDLIENISIIPGYGEFIYDTIIQKKYVNHDAFEIEEKINSENHEEISDSIYSLNKLIKFAPNLNWVRLNVAWFCNNSDLAKIKILPAVEDKNNLIRYSQEWQVRNYNRKNALLLSKTKSGICSYGGTPSDDSILRFIDQLRKKGLKTLFNPILLIDDICKTWRGEIFGDPKNISNFFLSNHGYRNFILHYAYLLKGKIDGFIIASEFVALNSIKNGNIYPSVEELIKLAKEVKQILGPDILVSYSADWSEYKNGQWNQLENLWASSSIDFIGLNFKFPSWYEDINFDYILEDEMDVKAKELYEKCCFGSHNYLMQNYHDWKILINWWNHDGRNQWKARSKNIWFTEFNFADIDKGCNDINYFYTNPDISESNSKSVPDILMQQHLLHKTIELLKEFSGITKIFLSYWDVTSYPICSHFPFWKEEDSWECPYCLENKLSGVDLASAVAEICDKGNIKVVASNFTLNKIIQGLACNSGNLYSFLAKLSHLYNFSICENNILSFIENKEDANENKVKYYINKNDLVKFFGQSDFKILSLNAEEFEGKVVLNFIDRSKNYKNQTITTNANYNTAQKNLLAFDSNVVLSSFEASIIAEKMRIYKKSKQSVVEFCLPMNYMLIKPSDIVEIYYNKKIYVVVIIHVKFMDNVIWLLAIITSERT